MIRTILLSLLGLSLGFAQVPLAGLTFGGSDNASIHGVALDSPGNIYVVGTTYSSDLTVNNAAQPISSGTEVIYSTDSGTYWMPLASPLPAATPNPNFQIAVDPTNPSIVYTASGTTFCKSLDGGPHFSCGAIGGLSRGLSIASLLLDPRS